MTEVFSVQDQDSSPHSENILFGQAFGPAASFLPRHISPEEHRPAQSNSTEGIFHDRSSFLRVLWEHFLKKRMQELFF